MVDVKGSHTCEYAGWLAKKLASAARASAMERRAARSACEWFTTARCPSRSGRTCQTNSNGGESAGAGAGAGMMFVEEKDRTMKRTQTFQKFHSIKKHIERHEAF